MRRESWRLVVVFALVSAACTNGAADGTTTTEQATASSAIESTTTNAPPTTTTTSTTGETTTTTEFTDTVGSPEALAAVVDEAMANSELAFPDANLDLISLPDLNTPDPTIAARALLLLEYEVSATAPSIEWLDVISAPESPAMASLRAGLETLSTRRLRVELSDGEFRVDTTELITREALASQSDRELPEDVPPGSVYVMATTSSPPFRLVDEDGVAISENPGWTQRPRALLLATTVVGWQVYWEADL